MCCIENRPQGGQGRRTGSCEGARTGMQGRVTSVVAWVITAELPRKGWTWWRFGWKWGTVWGRRGKQWAQGGDLQGGVGGSGQLGTWLWPWGVYKQFDVSLELREVRARGYWKPWGWTGSPSEQRYTGREIQRLGPGTCLDLNSSRDQESEQISGGSVLGSSGVLSSLRHHLYHSGGSCPGDQAGLQVVSLFSQRFLGVEVPGLGGRQLWFSGMKGLSSSRCASCPAPLPQTPTSYIPATLSFWW